MDWTSTAAPSTSPFELSPLLLICCFDFDNGIGAGTGLSSTCIEIAVGPVLNDAAECSVGDGAGSGIISVDDTALEPVDCRPCDRGCRCSISVLADEAVAVWAGAAGPTQASLPVSFKQLPAQLRGEVRDACSAIGCSVCTGAIALSVVPADA